MSMQNDLERSPEYNSRAPGAPEMVASSGISVRLWRLYAQAWLVCLLFPVIYLVQTPLAPVRVFLAVTGLATFAIVYTWFVWPHPLESRARPRSGSLPTLLALTGLTVLVFALIALYGSAFLWLLVGISAVIGVTLTARTAFIVVLALTLVTLGLGVALSGGIARTDWLQLVPLVLLVRGLGLDMVGLARLSVALRELHAARGELARRAVMEERLRLARDLHDLLGRTLSLITLKSELAGRLIKKEPLRAAQEIQEVERVARQALREVREAVAGYRQPTLRQELDGARQILEAAGIQCAIEQTTGGLPPPLDAALAWTVREGVTNVIRHSRARQCHIQVKSENGRVWAEIINDGYRATEQNPAHTQSGSGLAGLAERLAAQGGRLEAGPFSAEDRSCFRLRVELPMQSEPNYD